MALCEPMWRSPEYCEGFAAGQAGRPKASNPKPTTMQRTEWWRGRDDARRDQSIVTV